MDFTAEISSIEQPVGSVYRLIRSGRPMEVGEVLLALTNDRSFRLAYNRILRDASYPAFFWEHPRFTSGGLEEVYTFALLNSKRLADIKANSAPFANYFSKQEEVVQFSSLRGDAELIVPNANLTELDFSSLAQFVRTAPEALVDACWQLVGLATLKSLEKRDVFLNTSGLGVSWLHIRLDSRPKYYIYSTFKNT